MNAPGPIEREYDVIIVGAGISGIGMAAHLSALCPQKRFVLLERREGVGGTWDLFRYPGIRSDSDMFTLSYGFDPWPGERSISDGASIRAYLEDVARRHGIMEKIRFGQTVLSADWNSAEARWTLTVEDCDGTRSQLAGRFLFMGTGYYDHDDPHDPEIAGIESFAGEVVHPQFWPEKLDCAGKRIAVIGSGATAVSMVPALAEKAALVTMVQRSPAWYLERPSRDWLADLLRKALPARWANSLVRRRNVALQDFIFRRARQKPEPMARFLKNQLARRLGTGFEERHFTPPYPPWEQRLCIVADGDLFVALGAGKAAMATGAIRCVDKDGIVMDDGSRVDADIIVTATGLRLAALGKVGLSLDGVPVDPSKHFYYRNCMFSNVPNFAVMFGYLNASWTLRVDLVADWLCRLFKQMDAWGVDVVTPFLAADHDLVEDSPFDRFSSGYLRRGRAIIPKSAAQSPWRISMRHREDRTEMRQAPIDDGILRFERRSAPLLSPQEQSG